MGIWMWWPVDWFNMKERRTNCKNRRERINWLMTRLIGKYNKRLINRNHARTQLHQIIYLKEWNKDNKEWRTKWMKSRKTLTQTYKIQINELKCQPPLHQSSIMTLRMILPRYSIIGRKAERMYSLTLCKKSILIWGRSKVITMVKAISICIMTVMIKIRDSRECQVLGMRMWIQVDHRIRGTNCPRMLQGTITTGRDIIERDTTFWNLFS